LFDWRFGFSVDALGTTLRPVGTWLNKVGERHFQPILSREDLIPGRSCVFHSLVQNSLGMNPHSLSCRVTIPDSTQLRRLRPFLPIISLGFQPKKLGFPGSLLTRGMGTFHECLLND
jgi:hypothetical protein